MGRTCNNKQSNIRENILNRICAKLKKSKDKQKTAKWQPEIEPSAFFLWFFWWPYVSPMSFRELFVLS